MFFQRPTVAPAPAPLPPLSDDKDTGDENATSESVIREFPSYIPIGPSTTLSAVSNSSKPYNDTTATTNNQDASHSSKANKNGDYVIVCPPSWEHSDSNQNNIVESDDDEAPFLPEQFEGDPQRIDPFGQFDIEKFTETEENLSPPHSSFIIQTSTSRPSHYVSVQVAPGFLNGSLANSTSDKIESTSSEKSSNLVYADLDFNPKVS